MNGGRKQWRRRSLRITRHTDDAARDVGDEIAFHIEMRAAELIDAGIDPATARREAERAFGDRAAVERATRAIAVGESARARRAEWLGSLLRDLRYAARGLRRDRGFTVAAILTLALCIGANVAVFTVVNDVVLRPLPFPDADRLVTFYNSYPGSGIARTGNSVPDFFDRGENLAAMEHLALYNEVSATIGDDAAAANIFVSHVSPPFFDVLGVDAAIGRTFDDADGVVGQNRNVVISHGFWQSHFGGVDNILGRTLEVERAGGEQVRGAGNMFTVIGVMPEGFEFVTWNAQVWFAFAWPEPMRTADRGDYYSMIGRLHAGASVAEAQQQLDALTDQLAASYPPEDRRALAAAGFHSVVHGWQDDLTRDFRAPLYLLWASVTLVLLIGAFNIANLSLLRMSARLRELSTRFVLGAGRWRIARQLFTESLVLSAIGGALGLALGASSLRFLTVFEHYQVPRLSEVTLDAQTVLFTGGIAVAVAAAAAALPMLMMRRRDLYAAFRGGASTAGGGDGQVGALSVCGVLVAGQVAAAFVLVTTGGLLLSSIMNLWAVDTGFNPDNVAGGAVLMSPDRYPEAADRVAFRARATDALESIPGVRRAAFASQLPFSGAEGRIVFFPEGYEFDGDEAAEAHFYTRVTPGYFETLQIPIVAGRNFRPGDDLGAPAVIIVDEYLAQRYWPGDNPIGRRVALSADPGDDDAWLTVVGIVGNIVQNDLDDTTPRGAFYMSAAQSGSVFRRFVLRTEGADSSIHEQARRTLRALDPQMAAFWTVTMRGSLAERLIPRRIPMMLVMGFAALALLLTTLGVYGVLAFAATRRTREFGIRIALGGSAGEIYRLMLRDAGLLIVGGLVVGAIGAAFLNQLIAGQLYGVQPGDPRVIAAASALIAAVALLACLAPTRRATRVDPMVALRQD